MNPNKQLKNTLNTFKRNISKTANQIELDRKEGRFDTTVVIEGKQYDLMEMLLDSIYASNDASELMHDVDKELINGARNGDNKFKTNEAIQLTYIAETIEEVGNIHSMSLPRKLMFGMEDSYFNRMVAETAELDTDKIFSNAIACLVVLAKGADNEERCLTNNTALYLTCSLYVLAKNGYVFDALNISGINGLLKADECLVKGCTFETFLNWLKSYGVEADVLASYIKLRCSKEISKEQLKIFYKQISKEFTRSIMFTHSKESIEKARKTLTDSEKYTKIISALKRNGVNAADMIIYCIETKYKEGSIYSMLANMCIAFNVSRSTCELLLKLAARNLELKVISAIEMLSNKSLIQHELCEKLRDMYDKQTDELAKQKEAGKKYKSQAKQAEKEAKEMREQLNTQKRKNIKQVEYINSLKEKGVTDIQPLQAEKDKLNSLLEESRQTAEELKRDRNKAKASLEQITSQYEKLKKQLEDTEQQLVIATSKIEESQSKINSIDIECYINAIRNKKIAIYGGDMMHSELKGLGLKGLKLFSASNRNISMSDLAYQDIIVVVTGYMSHSTMHIPKGAAEKFNVPIYYFNNKNVSMLIQEVFSAIYKDTEGNG